MASLEPEATETIGINSVAMGSSTCYTHMTLSEVLESYPYLRLTCGGLLSSTHGPCTAHSRLHGGGRDLSSQAGRAHLKAKC